MQVGDLVTVAPAKTGIYIVTSLESVDPYTGTKLSECVMLASLSGIAQGLSLPMDRKWIEVLSVFRQTT